MESQRELWARRRADMIRRRDVDKELGELYGYRAGKEKHISRVIPEYSEEWDNDPSTQRLAKSQKEKRIGAEMVMLTVEKEDLEASHRAYVEAVGAYVNALSVPEGEENEQAKRYQTILKQMDLMDRALLSGQKIIRQTGMIQRSMTQALKFRFGRKGLSEPLKIALRGVDNMEPTLREFYTLIEEPCIDQDLRRKIKYCQMSGKDWVWEQFDLDIMGLITRLFHRPDMKRFSEAEVELLDIRFRVYNALARVAKHRSKQTDKLLTMAEEFGIGVFPEEETAEAAE